MQNCYCCGKILFGKKVLGEVGGDVFYFCSEKCRSITWNRIGVKKTDSLDTSYSDINENQRKSNSDNRTESRVGVPSKTLVEGAEYTYSAKTDRVTIKIRTLINKSAESTGSLRFELFFSKDGKYSGRSLNGVTLAVSSIYKPLKKNYNYTDITSTVLKSNSPKPGTYQPILFVKELNQDGKWYVSSFVNFPNSQKWI